MVKKQELSIQRETGYMEPKDVIAKQLETYNNRDLDGFSQLFTEDVKAYDLKSGELRMSGMAELRERYGERFESSPDLHSKVLQRVSLGTIVIDDEDIAGFGGDNVRIVAIYEVTGEKISRMWFIRGDRDESAIEPVELQLNGYNSRDIDMFLSAYHPDCEISDLQTSELRMKGYDQMKERYTSLFNASPDLKATIVSRIQLDDFVIDQEEVVGWQGDQNVSALAYYQVENGKIIKVWFSR